MTDLSIGGKLWKYGISPPDIVIITPNGRRVSFNSEKEIGKNANEIIRDDIIYLICKKFN